MMLYFVMSHHNHARPVIAYFGLKKDMAPCPFTIFTAGDVVLCLSGQGCANAAAATAYILTRWGREGLFVHLSPGDGLYPHTITDGTGSVYPEMLFKPPGFLPGGISEDSEAFFSFQSASKFLPLKQIIILRSAANEQTLSWIQRICYGLQIPKYLNKHCKGCSTQMETGNISEIFSHIYIEADAQGYPITDSVISWFDSSTIVPIRHYKDIFNRPGQDFLMQKQTPKLILARRRGNFLYEGSPLCERYGHSRFYYATMMMNCLYNCAYCYLQGMYPSANLVAFVNPEDYFPSVEASLPCYLSISFDADILALEDLFGYVKTWADFVRSHPGLMLEVRSKSANFAAISKLVPVDNMILSWTVSSQSMIDVYEEDAPSLSARLKSVEAAIKKGWRVRLCLDPLLPGWEPLFEQLPPGLCDINIGGFRMIDGYYKKWQKMRPDLPEPSCDENEIERASERARRYFDER